MYQPTDKGNREFIDSNNNDLLKNWGNLCQRVVKFAHAKLGGVVPDYTKYVDQSGSFDAFKKEVNEHLQTYIKDLKATKLRAGLSTILAISAAGNKLLQDNKLSNQLITEEPERCAAVVGIVLNLLHLLANLAFPYMPGTSEAIFAQLGFAPDAEGRYGVHIPDEWTADLVKPGQKLGEPKLLFSAIPAAKLDEWRETFGGEELKLQKAAEAEKAAAKKAAKEKEKEKKKAKKLAAAAQAAGAAGEEGKDAAAAKEGGNGGAKGPAIGETPLVHRDKA
jgi:methionyl-tRNA synthetase